MSNESQTTTPAKPQPRPRLAVAPKGQRGTKTKSVTATSASAPLKARGTKPKPASPLPAAAKKEPKAKAATATSAGAPRKATRAKTTPAPPTKPKGAKKADKKTLALRRRLVNAALFLLLLLAISIWAEINRDKLAPLGATLGTVTGLSILFALLRWIPAKAVSSVGEIVTNWLIRTLGSRRTTPVLAALAALGLPLAGLDSYLHHRSYALLIALGTPVVGEIGDYRPDLKPERFTIVVARRTSGNEGQVAASMPLVGTGPIYAGAAKRYLRWRDGQPTAKKEYKDFQAKHEAEVRSAARAFKAAPNQTKTPDQLNEDLKDRIEQLKEYWEEPPQFMPSVNVRTDDHITVQLRCTHSEALVLETAPFLLENPRLVLIPLELGQKDPTEFNDAVAKCSAKVE